MWTLICLLLMVAVFGKLIGIALKTAWGITKIVFALIFLPIIILALIVCGLFYIAIPILAIVGLVTVIALAA